MALGVSMSILIIVVIALCMANGAFAFGAGEIPDVSAMAKIGTSAFLSIRFTDMLVLMRCACTVAILWSNAFH